MKKSTATAHHASALRKVFYVLLSFGEGVFPEAWRHQVNQLEAKTTMLQMHTADDMGTQAYTMEMT